MKIMEWVRLLESIAPPSLAMEGDNVGLLVGTARTDIKKVLVALDCTQATAEEAISLNCDALLTHHPIFYTPVRRFDPFLTETAAAYALVRAGIAHYAAHTNLDAAKGGVNDCLCERLSILNASPLPPINLGRIGTAESGMTLHAFAKKVQDKLEATVHFAGESNAPVRRVAVTGGNGGSALYDAHLAGADTLLTGEMKHSQALEALALGLNVVVAGHYETEHVVLQPLIERLQGLSDDVEYKLARSETAPLRGLR